jgi:hypothetical protein
LISLLFEFRKNTLQSDVAWRAGRQALIIFLSPICLGSTGTK